MRTKKNLTIAISLFSVTISLGLLISSYAAQQQANTSEQDKTQSVDPQKAKVADQQNAQAAGQQKTVPPPERQKIKPADLQKAKARENTLTDYYKRWLNEDVIYIITPEERDLFKALTTDEERENFIEQFWARRNEDPREGGNQFKVEHYRRIAYANEHFASGIPGWKTDRGRIYILYGEPDGKESHPSGGSYQREFWEGGGQTSVYPFERWRYRHIDNVGDDVELEFVDKTFTGEYRLAMDAEEKDALLTVPNAGLTESEEMGLTKKEDRVNYGYMSQTDFQRSKDAPFERLARYFNVQRPPQIKFADLKGIVTTRITYNQLPYTMRTDFIRLSATKVMVPITIELDNKNLEFKKEMGFNRASVNVYGEITTLQARIAGEFENTISAEYTDEFFEAGKNKRSIYQAMVFLDAGQRYRLDLILKDLNSGYVGSMSYGIMVPKFDGEDLQTSSVILANSVNGVPPTYDHLEQFVIGDMKVQPNVKSEYVNGQNLIPYFQIYNAAYDQATLEPSLQISYTVKSGDKVVQDIEDTKGRTVQFTSGQRVVIVAQIPVKDMAPGRYKLEMKILDRISNKSLTTNADFQVVK
ncbi:MAG: GWxTD domain-containing protein [Acidobacteriia bacterium]|nr:GWxTD domain-containing protein [Terriglobia bacterium]